MAMNRSTIIHRCFILVFCIALHASLGFGQQNDPARAAVRGIMTTAVSRCYSTVNGVKRITFVPPTEEEFNKVRALGDTAVAPLAEYLELEHKDDLTQFMTVKFLLAIGGVPILPPLERAFARDQWEVTRAAALSGMFIVSRVKAKPYIEVGLRDESSLVRQRANDLWSQYR